VFVQLYKRTTKSFLDIFTRQRYTQEIIIDMGKSGVWQISEHQLGSPLRNRHVNILFEGRSYSMDMETLIKKVIS